MEFLAFLFLGSALASGCVAAEGQSVAAPKGSTSATVAPAGKVRTSTPATSPPPRDPSYAQKPALVRDMGRKLLELQRQIDQLSAQVDRSRAAAKVDAKAKLALVRQHWARAKEQLDQATRSTEGTWESVKRGVRRSYAEVQDSLEQTRQWLSDKIEPAKPPVAVEVRRSGHRARDKE